MASGPPFNLNFAPSVPPPRIIAPGYLVSRLISSYIGYMLVMGVLGLIVPKFESLFNETGLKQPAATAALFAASQLCIRGYLWVICLPLPAMWALVNASINDKYRRRRLRLAAFVFVVAFLIFTLGALFIPMSGVILGGTTLK